MSDLTVTVTASEQFPDNTAITRAMLRNAAVPKVVLDGTIGTADLSDSAITNAKVASGIAASKLTLSESTLLMGGNNDSAVFINPDNDTTSTPIGAGGYDGTNSKKRARFIVSMGTDPNQFAALGTDVGSVGGDVIIDVNNNRLKCTINDNSVEAKMLHTNFGGQSSDSDADAYNASPTIGVSGSGSNAFAKVLDNSIGADQLAHAINSEYYGGLYAFTSNGSPAQIKGGSTGQVLTGRGNSNPTFQTLYTDLNLGTPPSEGNKYIRMKHGLTYTPTDLKLYLKCTESTRSDNTHQYYQNDIVMLLEQDNENAYMIFADSTHFCYNQQGVIYMRKRPYATTATTNDSTSPVNGTDPITNNWSAITVGSWELHALVR